MSRVRRFLNDEELIAAAAEHVSVLAAAAIKERGHFSIVLSGGRTPAALFQALVDADIDWQYVYVFWGDERCVPPDDPDSNYGMAYETLLQHVPVPPENIHRMAGDIDPAQAAAEYEHQLRIFFGKHTAPRFDLILLGMGDDGHTVSLFPGTAAIHETRRWVVAHHVEKLDSWRITLTPVVINAARQVTFLVKGASKAPAFKRVLSGEFNPDEYPSQIIKPADGDLLWLVDAAAATEEMPSWSQFAEEVPDLARLGQERLTAGPVYLATVRKHGAPRVHPVTAIIGQGRLFVFMEPTSPKGHDLRRDGRYALHNSVENAGGGRGEFAISGRATLIQDVDLRAIAVEAAPNKPAERYILFELSVESVISTVYEGDDYIPDRECWNK